MSYILTMPNIRRSCNHAVYIDDIFAFGNTAENSTLNSTCDFNSFYQNFTDFCTVLTLLIVISCQKTTGPENRTLFLGFVIAPGALDLLEGLD